MYRACCAWPWEQSCVSDGQKEMRQSIGKQIGLHFVRWRECAVGAAGASSIAACVGHCMGSVVPLACLLVTHQASAVSQAVGL